jgi:hypothetical protein
MMLATSLSYIPFIMLRYIHSIPSFIRAFNIKRCWLLSKAFSATIEVIMCFLSLLLLMCCICWTILASLGWSQLNYIFLIWCWIQFVIILLTIFAFMSIKEIGL